MAGWKGVTVTNDAAKTIFFSITGFLGEIGSLVLCGFMSFLHCQSTLSFSPVRGGGARWPRRAELTKGTGTLIAP
jgi:hypothetical protein